MDDRRFDEVDLRRMLARASGYRVDVAEDRWVVDVRHHRQAWQVTAYPVWE